jgi:hypothetical protein
MVERVLVVCPASLQMQWHTELKSKFNEDFQIVDGSAIKLLGRDGTNPWLKVANAICSLPLAGNPKRAEHIVDAGWDLVIFDEAHRVRRHLEARNKTRSTQACRLADDLKDQANGVLLLTATPMQLHPFEIFSLIELVEPGMYPTFEAYEQRRADLPRLNDLMRALKGWGALDEPDRARTLREHASVLAQLEPSMELGALLEDPERREEFMDRLVARHPLANVMVRNRKAVVGGFTRREARSFLVPLTEAETGLYWDVTDYLRHVYLRARDNKKSKIGFVMVTYQKMLASSSAAIQQSLKRRSQKLRDQLKGMKQARRRADASDDLEDLEDAEEASAAVAEASFVDQEVLKWEIDAIDGLVARLGLSSIA